MMNSGTLRVKLNFAQNHKTFWQDFILLVVIYDIAFRNS